LLLHVSVYDHQQGTFTRAQRKAIFGLRFGKNYVVMCYTVVWQHVVGMVCVLFAVLSATRTQHTAQYTHHTNDMLPHHRITHNDVVFTES